MEEEQQKLLETMIKIYLEKFRLINRKFEFKEEELTRQDIRLLEYVQFTDDCNEVVTMKSFIEYFEIDNPSKGTRFIDKLVKNGFIERRATKKDRRKVILDLTPKAQKLMQERQRSIFTNFLHVFSKLTKEDLINQIEILGKLLVD
ncbi:MAG: MarR family winged helix-turn-helix transcriptional regulator [Candidatus Hodarchaeales archaeon]